MPLSNKKRKPWMTKLLRKASNKEDRLKQTPRKKETPKKQKQYRKQKIFSETKENKIYKTRTECNEKKSIHRRRKKIKKIEKIFNRRIGK